MRNGKLSTVTIHERRLVAIPATYESTVVQYPLDRTRVYDSGYRIASRPRR